MNYEELVEYRNANNPYCRNQGIVLEEVRQGYGRATVTLTADDLNPAHVPHGGIYFVLADNACAGAASSYGYAVVTINVSFNFLNGAKPGDHLTAEAREVQHGRKICVYETEVKNQDGLLLCKGTYTMYQLLNKPLS